MKHVARPKPDADGSYGPYCAIRYEDDDGNGVPEGECYVHHEADPACRWQDPFRLDRYLSLVLA